MNHLMIDFETLDTSFSPVLLSVGAVVFEPERGLVSLPSENTNGLSNPGTFYRSLSTETSFALGGTISSDTLRFWINQSPEATRRAFAGISSIRQAMIDLATFAKHYGAEFVWSNGATFDIVIARGYFEKLKLEWPFKYFNERDTRTLWALGGDSRKKIEKPNGFIAHDPMWDAWLQAVAVSDAYSNLGFRADAQT